MGDNFKLVTKYLSKTSDVHVLTNEGIIAKDLNTQNIFNIEFNRKRISNFINPISYYKIYKFIRSIQFDVAFILSPHPLNLYIYQIIDNTKIIPYVHDHIPHSGVKGLDAFFLKAQLKYFYTKSKKIIVSSEIIKKEIIEKGFIKETNRIEVNYLGLLENHLYPITKTEEIIDILFFGRIEYYKGLDILIKAAANLSKYNFHIIGKGDIKKVFNINTLPDNCIHINRYVTDHELAEYIQKSKVIVLPYRDATGTQTIQSIFYYNKPIIATNVGCFPEYISNGIDGLIVKKESVEELSKAIEYLLNENEHRKEMGDNGKKKLTTIFCNKDITNKYIQIFSKI